MKTAGLELAIPGSVGLGHKTNEIFEAGRGRCAVLRVTLGSHK